MSQDSAVGMATHYALLRSRDRILVRARFSSPSRAGRRLTQPPVKWTPRLFPGYKAAGATR